MLYFLLYKDRGEATINSCFSSVSFHIIPIARFKFLSSLFYFKKYKLISIIQDILIVFVIFSVFVLSVLPIYHIFLILYIRIFTMQRMRSAP